MNAEARIQEAITNGKLDFRPALPMILSWGANCPSPNTAAHWVVNSPHVLASWYRDHFLPPDPPPVKPLEELPLRPSMLMDTALGGVWVKPMRLRTAAVGYPNDHPDETIGHVKVGEEAFKLAGIFERTEDGRWRSGFHRMWAWQSSSERIVATIATQPERKEILDVIGPTLEAFWQSNQLEFLSAAYVDVNNRLAKVQAAHALVVGQYDARSTRLANQLKVLQDEWAKVRSDLERANP